VIVLGVIGFFSNAFGIYDHFFSSNDLTGVKQETSADPRKELQNMGVAWSQDRFREAIRMKDMRVIKLFIEGGMKWDIIESFKPELSDLFDDEIVSLFIDNDVVLTSSCPRPKLKPEDTRNANGKG